MQKSDTLESINILYEGREIVLNAFKSGIFPLQPTDVIGRPGMSASLPSD